MTSGNLHRLLVGTAAAMLTATPVGGQAPAPSNAWMIDYSETRCTARRSFEDNGRALTIAIRPSLDAKSYEVTVSRPGGEYQLPMQIRGTADFGHGAAKHWVLKHRNPTDSSQVYRFQVPATELVPPAVSGKISFGAEEYRARVEGADLAAAIGALDTCLEDLRDYWNASSPKAATSATTRNNLNALLKPDNHIDGGLFGGVRGTAHYVLFIDQEGKLAGCEAVMEGASPALDHLGCSILREQGQFTPALDSNGNPIRNVIVTPPVRWRIG
jgi:hypothetical protein